MTQENHELLNRIAILQQEVFVLEKKEEALKKQIKDLEQKLTNYQRFNRRSYEDQYDYLEYQEDDRQS